MARLYTTGFELNSTTTGVESDTFSSVTVSTTQKRSGAYAMRCNPAGTTPFWRQVVFLSDTAGSLFFRAYLYIATTPTGSATQIMRIANTPNSPLASIELTTGNQLRLLNGLATQLGSNSATLSNGQWYRIEISRVSTTGVTNAYIDGVLFATGTGTTGNHGRVLLGAVTGTPTGDWYFDDVAVNDTTGSAQTGLPGEGKVVYLRPDSAGDNNTFATQTGGTAGAANAFTRVNESPPNDATSYNGSATLNEVDMMNVDAGGILSTDTVTLVALHSRYRNSTTDTSAAIKMQIEKASGGTIAQSASQVPANTAWFSTMIISPTGFGTPLTLYVDPDGSAWGNPANWQIGYKLTTAPSVAARRVDVTAIWAIVEYVAGVAARVPKHGFINHNNPGIA